MVQWTARATSAAPDDSLVLEDRRLLLQSTLRAVFPLDEPRSAASAAGAGCAREGGVCARWRRERCSEPTEARRAAGRRLGYSVSESEGQRTRGLSHAEADLVAGADHRAVDRRRRHGAGSVLRKRDDAGR